MGRFHGAGLALVVCLFCASVTATFKRSGEDDHSGTSRNVAALVRSPGRKSVTQNLSVSMVDDGRSAAVRFAAGGKQYHYDMSLFSVYTEGAEAIAVTNGTVEYLDIHDSQTFNSRLEGRWASALLHGNGSVSGVFEHDGEFLELQPSDSASLLATEGNSSNVHEVWYHAFEDLTVPSGDLMNTSLLEMGKPRIIRDDPVVDEDGVEHMFHIPAGADAPHDEYGPRAKKGTWCCTWWHQDVKTREVDSRLLFWRQSEACSYAYCNC